jgi:hypothetical protein
MTGNLPLNTDLVISRLKNAVPVLRGVSDAIEFDAIKELRLITDNRAFVVLDNEKNSADVARHTNQTFARFGVVVATRCARPSDLMREARALIGQTRDALIGWRPENREFQSCVWLGGEVLDYDQNVLLWVDMYQTNYFTNGV